MDKFFIQIADKVIPLLLVLFVVVVGSLQQFLRYRRRVLLHKERLLAMEKGLDLPPDSVQATPLPPEVCILRGLLWLFIGIASMLCLIAISLMFQGHDRMVAMAWALTGIVPAAVGCAYLLYYRIESKLMRLDSAPMDTLDRSGEPTNTEIAR